MRGDSMLFFNKKLKYLVFENDNFNQIVKIDEIAYIETVDYKNDFFIDIKLINGSLLKYACFSEEVRDKTYEKIKNILIN